MPITDNMRMQVIATYPNAPIVNNGKKYKIRCINLYAKCIELDTEMTTTSVRANTCQILLRPISSLTDEEVECVARILFGEKSKDRLAYMIQTKWAGEFIDKLYKTPLTSDKVSNVIDYLRSINIITTVHGFDLVKEGIAIVDETKTI